MARSLPGSALRPASHPGGLPGAARSGWEEAVFWGLAGVVALAPLPLGSNRAWAWSALALAAGLLLMAWALVRGGRPHVGPWRKHAPATILYALALAWGLFQALPLAPESWAHALWGGGAQALDPAGGGLAPSRVSLDPEASVTGVMRLASYGVVFWLALNLCRQARRASALFWTVALAGSAYALYGLVVQFSGEPTILWFDKWVYADSVTGTFVNRNHFAAFAGMTLVVILALLADEGARAGLARARGPGDALRAMAALRGWGYVLIAAAAIVATALLLSLSRGGVIASGLGVIVLLAALGGRSFRGGLRGWLFLLLLASAAAGILLWASGAGVGARLASQEQVHGTQRGTVYRITAEAVAARPLLGYGLGAYGSVFRHYRDNSVERWSARFAAAHDSYLELAVELGAPGMVAIEAALAWLALLCLAGTLRRRRHRHFACAGLALAALLGAHSLVDFPLQIPAIATVFAALLGAACAQSWSTRRAQDLAPEIGPRSAPGATQIVSTTSRDRPS